MKAIAIRRTLITGFLGLFILSVSVFGQSEPPWAWGPILGAISEDTVALTWKTVRPVGFDFSYSLAPVYDSSGQWEEVLTYEGHEGIAEIWLQDLLPNTAYRYQLVFYEGDAVYPTEIGTFRTADPDDRSFSFAVYGATASHPDRHKLVADTINRQPNLSFVLHAGGLVEMPTDEHYDNFFWAMANLSRRHPYLPVIGERDADESIYYESFALPSGGGVGGEQWWAFDYGSVRFIGLDSTLTGVSEISALQEQTAWLEQELSEHSDRIVVVLCADPIYSASYASGIHETLHPLWSPLFRQYGVNLVISSSIHCYEHIYADGLHYVISGGGGASLIPAPVERVPGTVFRRYGLLHYLVGTVADDTLQVEVIPVASIVDDIVTLSASGRSIDTFVLQRDR